MVAELQTPNLKKAVTSAAVVIDLVVTSCRQTYPRKELFSIAPLEDQQVVDNGCAGTGRTDVEVSRLPSGHAARC